MIWTVTSAAINAMSVATVVAVITYELFSFARWCKYKLKK
jgi:hypothetical protein